MEIIPFAKGIYVSEQGKAVKQFKDKAADVESQFTTMNVRLQSMAVGKSATIPVCSSCVNPGHKQTLDEFSKVKFEWKVERFSRKVYLKSIIRDEYNPKFSDRIIFLSDYVRNILFRAQIFVNSYVCNYYESEDLKVITQTSSTLFSR
ncbi:hypothetical protein HPULCUR_010134 [Helicostylum pulchrum]|uniref:Uncharacterized protein n=1 Tax=Helicostylum pulchrum TaxID=562976 RepID=A0ABP9YCF7_9FUNG